SAIRANAKKMESKKRNQGKMGQQDNHQIRHQALIFRQNDNLLKNKSPVLKKIGLFGSIHT
ncbi:MAG: hypothetical protein COU72_00300, partial [Parcubacteria group bacterium CG10_big_fil_rev_8_21_14_0_10_41_35]